MEHSFPTSDTPSYPSSIPIIKQKSSMLYLCDLLIIIIPIVFSYVQYNICISYILSKNKESHLSRIRSTLVFFARTSAAIHIIFVYIGKTILTFSSKLLIPAGSYNLPHIPQISGQWARFLMIFAVTGRWNGKIRSPGCLLSGHLSVYPRNTPAIR